MGKNQRKMQGIHRLVQKIEQIFHIFPEKLLIARKNTYICNPKNKATACESLWMCAMLH